MVRQFQQAKESGSLIVRFAARLEDRIFSKKFDGLYELSDDAARRTKFAGGMTLYYFKEMGTKTAADYLLESAKPALIMQGGMDFQVLASEDYALFQELLAERPNVEWRLYEDLNHLFVRGIYHDIAKASKEYRVERHVDSKVMDDIAEFIHATR
jgi:acetyl esterase/lipase